MTFVVIALAFCIVQYWGFGDWAHRDQWYRSWSKMADSLSGSAGGEVQVSLRVLVPVLALYVLLEVLSFSLFLQMCIALPVLLYSLGRGDFTEWVKGYAEAYHRSDNVAAAEYATRLGMQVDEVEDWNALHRRVLRQAGYRGFERMFAAIFWFAILGPVGALLYRLAALSMKDEVSSDGAQLAAARLTWLLEWPVVRVLGLSFALTGNFVGCFKRWKECLMCTDRPTDEIMEHYVHGALNLNGEELVLEQVTEQEVEALLPLLSRTLVLWLCVLAVLSLFG